MDDTLVYRRLGLVLHDIADVETGAVAAFGLLLTTPYLPDADRRYLIERVRPEERGHDRMMREWAKKWAGPKRSRQLPYAAAVWRDLVAAARLDPDARFAYVFTTIRWNERNTLAHADGILSLLRRAGEGVWRDFNQVVQEEREHVAWSDRTLRRLEIEHPRIAAMAARYGDLTARVYPAVVNRAHWDAWQWLDRHLPKE
jgi:hypothetical protein